MKKNVVTELFLGEYYLVRSLLGKNIADKKALFYMLGERFFIPKAELDAIYDQAESQAIKSMVTDKDFYLYQRLMKYSKFTGESIETAQDEFFAEIKGNALVELTKLNLKSAVNAPKSVIYKKLTDCANIGRITGLRILGFLQCEGVLIEKNLSDGLKNLSKAAEWGDAISILYLLHYLEDERNFNIVRLKQVATHTTYYPLYLCAASVYGEALGENRELKLLEEAFCSAFLKRDLYEPKYSRLIYSTAITFEEKKRLVFSVRRESMSVVTDLPLKLSKKDYEKSDLPTLSQTMLCREKEKAEILGAYQNFDLCNLSTYRPLCICSDTQFLLNLYAKMFDCPERKLHVFRVDVKDLTQIDFDPSINNVFLRNVDEDLINVCLIFFTGSIDLKIASRVKTFLQARSREKFHLNSPSVNIDLSSVVPVCFCDSKNLSLVKDFCDVLYLSEVTVAEKSVVLESIFKERKELYNDTNVTCDESFYKELSGYTVDEAEKVIDEAIRDYRNFGKEIILTGENATAYTKHLSKKVQFGF